MHRELFEETGLTGEVTALLGIDSMLFPASPDFPDEVHSIRIVFEVAADGEPRVMEANGTVQDARWVSLDDLPSYPIVNLVETAMRMAGLS